MKITDLLKPQSILLNASPTNKADAIYTLGDLMDKGGNLSDKAEYLEAVFAREESGSTGLGDGIATPHAKSAGVKEAGLAAMVVPNGVDFEALDGQPSRLFFMIAAPEGAADTHVEVLSKLATMVIDPDFKNALIQSATVNRFLELITAKEEGNFDPSVEGYIKKEDEKAPSITDAIEAKATEAIEKVVPKVSVDNPHYEVLAVTGCPTGIAHTYMAAESLERKAKEMGISLKVEKNGASGIKDALTAEEIDGTGKLPRSIRTGYDMDFLCRQLERDPSTFQDSLRPQPTAEQMGKRRLCVVYDWTSGFFPGSLWYAYELTGNDTLKADAIQYTNLLNPVRYYKGTHDLGFMINCSYGNAERLAPNDTIKAVMKETADNLSGRFNDSIGAIRSWDFGSWNFPVIIDNMMNLDLLFTVSKWTGDNKYKDVAIKHAITTMKNHFRPDYTCWHVVSYNNDGTVERKQTHQGKNDDSSWSRGQAWAVYGYTSCYRETNDTTFLNFAVNIADMIMERVKTDDAIPYWDYDAPVTEETPRDASAAAVTAAGFIELSTMVPDGKKYLDYAEKILKSLSSDAYLAKVGENQGFILMHSVGSLPNGSEIDTPLNYADYYYLEALKRFMDLKKLRLENGEVKVIE